MQPAWLEMLAWFTLTLGLASAAVVIVDSFVVGYRQSFNANEVIWPVTGLYFGPAALIGYTKLARPQSPRWRERHGNPPERGRVATVAIELCGSCAHCALGTIIATVATFGIGLSIAGNPLFPEYIGDYLGAVAVSLLFRYLMERHRGARRVGTAIGAYVRADLLGVSIFELVLIIWLALVNGLVFPQVLRPSNPIFWFIVQSGLIVGFFAGWPVISLQVRRGRLPR